MRRVRARGCDNEPVPKIIGSSLADHRGQVRQRLFASLLELIAEHGYDSVTLADIAAGAGVGRTAVYNHFPDKESLLLALAHDQTEDYLVRLRAEMTADQTPLARLRTFLRMQMTELAGHHMRMAGIGTALTAQGRARMREHVAPMMVILQEILDDAIRAGEIPPQDVTTVSMLISSITAGRFTVGLTGAALDDAIEKSTVFVLRGVGSGVFDTVGVSGPPTGPGIPARDVVFGAAGGAVGDALAGADGALQE